MITALNHGLAQVATPFVAFMDSDDLWMPEKQERQVSLLQSDPSLDVVTCVATNVREESDGSLVELRSAPSSMFTASTFRLTTFERFGTIDTESTHFTWLYRWWSAAKLGGISTGHIDYVGLNRRLHGGNSWAEKGAIAHRELLAELRLIAKARRLAASVEES
jgi:glycosyltransferase involved in cell wall biosynthesis